jgi:hypothetical protein
MKKVYSVDLISSFFSKQEASELILGLMNYKIELHSNKMFSTQIKIWGKRRRIKVLDGLF